MTEVSMIARTSESRGRAGSVTAVIVWRPSTAASGVRRLYAVERPPPFRPQCARPLGVAFVQEPRGDHPVGPKASEVLAQFAPGDQMANCLHVPHRNRPNDALALAALFVAIKQIDFPARMNLRSHPRHIE